MSFKKACVNIKPLLTSASNAYSFAQSEIRLNRYVKPFHVRRIVSACPIQIPHQSNEVVRGCILSPGGFDLIIIS